MRPLNTIAFPLTLCGWLALLALPGMAAAAVSANFDDGTYGDLDAFVNVSDTSINTTLAALATSTTYGDHGLVDADLELYNSGGGGGGAGYSGGDKALIDTDETFGNVVVTGVAGLTTLDTWYGSEGAGIVAGMPAVGGSGYLLYIADAWYHGEGYFVEDGNTTDVELVLTRKDAAMSTPLNGATLYDVATVTNMSDTPYFLRLTVSGTAVTGEVWVNAESAVGSPDATVSFMDPNVLSGHTGVYLGIGHYGSSVPTYRQNYGVAAIDDFQATPEPATLGLLGLSWFGLAVMRMRRKCR